MKNRIPKIITSALLLLITQSAQADIVRDAYCRTLLWGKTNEGAILATELPMKVRGQIAEFEYHDLKVRYVIDYPEFTHHKLFQIRAEMSDSAGEYVAASSGSIQGKNMIELSFGNRKGLACFGEVSDVIIQCTRAPNRDRVDAYFARELGEPDLVHELPGCGK